MFEGPSAAGKAGRQDRADRGDREQAGDARDRVVDRGADAGVALIDVAQDRRGQRRHGAGEADAEHQHAGQHLGDVGGVRAHAQHQQESGGGDQRAEGHEPARPVFAGQAARDAARAANINTVTGQSASPAAVAGYPATCCRNTLSRNLNADRPA